VIFFSLQHGIKEIIKLRKGKKKLNYEKYFKEIEKAVLKRLFPNIIRA
jgi:hypothetical protein